MHVDAAVERAALGLQRHQRRPAAGGCEAEGAVAAGGQSIQFVDGSWTSAPPTPNVLPDGNGGENPEPREITPIADIQGTTDTSPMVGKVVTTTGVVTAVYPKGGFNGLYIQTPGSGGVAKAPTDASDGIFVHSAKAASAYTTGQCVVVSGEVSEFNGLTEINGTNVTETKGCADVKPVKLAALPRTDAQREALMRLAAEQRRSWSRLTGGGGRPRIPADMDRAHTAYERVYADLTHVGSVLADTDAGGDLLDTPWEELTAARIDALETRTDETFALLRRQSVVHSSRAFDGTYASVSGALGTVESYGGSQQPIDDARAALNTWAYEHNELVAALAGESRDGLTGRVTLNGVDITARGVSGRRAAGLATVPEERNGHAAVPGMSLAENAILSARQRRGLASGGLLKLGKASVYAAEIIRAFSVRATGPQAAAASLSGGNLQKYITGREIMQEPAVLVVAQPTWGVDAGAAGSIRQSMLDLAARGSAVVVVSQDLDELLDICDRIAVINGGRLSQPHPVGVITLDEIGLLMGGVHGDGAGETHTVEGSGPEAGPHA